MIETCSDSTTPAWLHLRSALWPGCPAAEHRDEMADIARRPDTLVALLALDEQGRALGLAEASVRHDYVNGSSTSPVAFLEGIYVEPAGRGQGVARALIAAVERWAAARGCSELASDAALDNLGSQRMHAALGFAETERVVYFLKPVAPLG
ncbi:aminoglycoside 6'-N-acetyltransferase [Pseudomonas sp. UFMG81]|jgi:aminoglycoside 6'-N-acetyltransferase I|uniref:aminoglycoside 6'-N-acetyltransferase n=1 Tax=Pseudomonas sp. UFMG81 TaxID=2745936 RepID=UPI00188F8970|nr:aminoglycoside 6'-N-acetyltransferase [Pseudomonas sp. UFMG81]